MFKRLKEILGVNECPSQVCPLCAGQGLRAILDSPATENVAGKKITGTLYPCNACNGTGVYTRSVK